MNAITKISAFYTGLPVFARVLLFMPIAVVFIGAGAIAIFQYARLATAARKSEAAERSSAAAGAALGEQLGKLEGVVDQGGKLVSDANDHRESDLDLIREARASVQGGSGRPKAGK